MEKNLTVKDVDVTELSNDLNSAIYMLHYVDDEIFSKEEVQNVSFSLRVMINSIKMLMEGEEG